MLISVSGRLVSYGGTQQLQAPILPAANPLSKDSFLSPDPQEVPKLISNIIVWYKRKFIPLWCKRNPELSTLWLACFSSVPGTQTPTSSSAHFYFMAQYSCSGSSHEAVFQPDMRGRKTESLPLKAFSWNWTQRKWVLLSKGKWLLGLETWVPCISYVLNF